MLPFLTAASMMGNQVVLVGDAADTCRVGLRKQRLAYLFSVSRRLRTVKLLIPRNTRRYRARTYRRQKSGYNRYDNLLDSIKCFRKRRVYFFDVK